MSRSNPALIKYLNRNQAIARLISARKQIAYLVEKGRTKDREIAAYRKSFKAMIDAYNREEDTK